MSATKYSEGANTTSIGPFNSNPGSSGKVVALLTIKNLGPGQLWIGNSSTNAAANGANAVAVEVGESLFLVAGDGDVYYGATANPGATFWVSEASLNAS